VTKYPVCQAKLRDGSPCRSVVVSTRSEDELDRRYCPGHADQFRQAAEFSAGDEVDEDDPVVESDRDEAPAMNVNGSRGSTPRDSIRAFALARPELMDTFLDGALAAEREVWVSCRHCQKKSLAPVPDWSARLRTIQLMIEEGFGKAEAVPLTEDEQLQAQFDLYLSHLSDERLMEIGSLEDFQKRLLSRPMAEQMALSEATADEVAAIAKKHGYSLAS
jgi:hypothetical protein